MPRTSAGARLGRAARFAVGQLSYSVSLPLPKSPQNGRGRGIACPTQNSPKTFKGPIAVNLLFRRQGEANSSKPPESHGRMFDTTYLASGFSDALETKW